MKSVDNNATQYSYDPLGRRVSKNESGSQTEDLYFGDNLIAEFSPQTGAWRDYVYAGASVFAEVDGTLAAQPVYRVENHIDSLGSLANSSGALTGTVDLAPYGQTITDQLQSHFKFAGLYRDDGTASDHALYREYSPAQGRWLSPDPYNGSYDLYNPQSLNRYSYILNNPLSDIDPEGLDAGDWFLGGGGAAVTPFCPWCGAILGIGNLFRNLFDWGGSDFQGTTTPRPSVIKRCPPILATLTGIGPKHQTGGKGGIEGANPKDSELRCSGPSNV